MSKLKFRDQDVVNVTLPANSIESMPQLISLVPVGSSNDMSASALGRNLFFPCSKRQQTFDEKVVIVSMVQGKLNKDNEDLMLMEECYD